MYNIHSYRYLLFQLGNVRLLESDPLSPKNKIAADTNGEFRTNLEESPLAFSFQDGRIEELCTSRPEKTWVLNIKRGILSSIQNSMTDFTKDQQVQEVQLCKYENINSLNVTYERKKITIGSQDFFARKRLNHKTYLLKMHIHCIL